MAVTIASARRRRSVVWLIALLVLSPVAASAGEEPCRGVSFRSADYTVCAFNPKVDKLALFDLDDAGKPYGSLGALDRDLKAKGRTLVFAMNAGMYDNAQKPVGLYVEHGRELKPVNRASGFGNFHLKPNGIFFVAGRKAGVAETEAYLRAKRFPDLATQSGPMLVIDGSLHPAFKAESASLKLRNGVGVGADGEVSFAISERLVSFYDFASLFRDELKIRNALFLDGSVSSLFEAKSGRHDEGRPLGPIVAVVK